MALAHVKYLLLDLMSMLSCAGECFLQENFMSDSKRIMRDIQSSAGDCQVILFSQSTAFDFDSRSRTTACTLE